MGLTRKQMMAAMMSSGGGSVTPVLPYDAEIEYLQTSGTQYIDTGVAQQVLDIETTLVVQWTGSTASQFETFFGYMAASPNVSPRCGIHKYQGNWMFGTNATNKPNAAVDGTKHTIFHTCKSSPSEESLYIDGTEVLSGDPSADGLWGNTITFFLGCRNRGSSIDNQCSAKFYSLKFKMFTGPAHKIITKELDLVPVRVGQVGYMYDRISGQLLGNSGSGSFTLGNDK